MSLTRLLWQPRPMYAIGRAWRAHTKAQSIASHAGLDPRELVSLQAARTGLR